MIRILWYNAIRWALSEFAIFASTFCAHGQCHRCRRPFQSPQVPDAERVAACWSQWWGVHSDTGGDTRNHGGVGEGLSWFSCICWGTSFRISQYNTSYINLCCIMLFLEKRSLQMHSGRNLFVDGNHWNNFWSRKSSRDSENDSKFSWDFCGT